MTLDEKLRNITKTSTVKTLNEYPDVRTAEYFENLWNDVIEPNLPSKDIVIQWHNLLMKYIEQNNAVFTLRKCGSKSEPRRGFLNKVFVDCKESFETFYTDNSVPFYFYSMAKDGFVPNFEEFNDAMIKNRTFPYGYFSSSTEKIFSAYQHGQNPGINTKGYKLAHIFSAGENYSSDAGYKTITEFCNSAFPQGTTVQWENHILPSGQHFRPIYLNDEAEYEKIRKFAVAHFLRSVHPINFFLVPLTNGKKDKEFHIKKTNIYWHDYEDGRKERTEIGEYPKLIEYVASRIKNMYEHDIGNSGKNIYQEFLDLIYPTCNCIDPKGENLQIDARYAIGIWKTKLDGEWSSTTLENKKIRSIPMNKNSEFSDFKTYVFDNGVNTPSGYTSKLRSIMKELNITSASSLGESIDSALDYCNKKIEESKVALNKKSAKKYSDYRSTLRKYKQFMEDQRKSILGNTINKVHKVEMIAQSKKLYVRYKQGYSSFVRQDEHDMGYCIEGDYITIYTGNSFFSSQNTVRKITPQDMFELLKIFDSAIKIGAFSKSNTSIQTIHGPICTYDYEYRGAIGEDCGALFTDDTLNTLYHNLIHKIIK